MTFKINVMEHIQDEFLEFKQELKKLGIEVIKIVKVGNGNMDFHEVFLPSSPQL